MLKTLFLATKPFDFAKIFGNIGSRWYYYVALAVVVVAVIIFSIFKDGNRNALTQTQKLVYVAIFSALSFLANYFTIKVSDVLQLSLVATVGFLAGYLLGAGMGFTAAFIGDLICGIVMPFGAYNPIIGIGTGLWGLIPGAVFAFSGKRKYIKTVLSFAICFVLNSFLVNTFGLSVMYQMQFSHLLTLLPVKFVGVVVNSAICLTLVAIMPKVLPKDKFFI